MRRARILLVDDSRVNRKLMAAVLEADGYRVDEAGSGREALEGVRLLSYDLVLMDLQMADMDGVAATVAIRALGGRRGEVPIVAISGDVESDIADRCLAAGMNEHLAKPITPGRLQQTVERWTKSKIDADVAAGAAAGGTATGLGGLAAHLSGAALVPVIDDFVAGAARRMTEIEQELGAGNLRRVRAIAHDLSGTAANLGLENLGQVARSVEIACTDGGADAVRNLLPGTRAAMEKAFALLATHRHEVERSTVPDLRGAAAGSRR